MKKEFFGLSVRKGKDKLERTGKINMRTISVSYSQETEFHFSNYFPAKIYILKIIICILLWISIFETISNAFLFCNQDFCRKIIRKLFIYNSSFILGNNFFQKYHIVVPLSFVSYF